MRDRISFSVVDSQEKYDALQQFAASFDHKEEFELPVVNINYGMYQIGYYQQLLHPVIIPAFHPKLTTPRSFKEAMDIITGSQQLRSISPQYPNGICFVATKNKDIERSNFDKLGYKNLGLEIGINVGGK